MKGTIIIVLKVATTADKVESRETIGADTAIVRSNLEITRIVRLGIAADKANSKEAFEMSDRPVPNAPTIKLQENSAMAASTADPAKLRDLALTAAQKSITTQHQAGKEKTHEQATILTPKSLLRVLSGPLRKIISPN
jgi:hypothetical protein